MESVPIQSLVAKSFFYGTYLVMTKALKISYLVSANYHFAHAKLLLS